MAAVALPRRLVQLRRLVCRFLGRTVIRRTPEAIRATIRLKENLIPPIHLAFGARLVGPIAVASVVGISTMRWNQTGILRTWLSNTLRMCCAPLEAPLCIALS